MADRPHWPEYRRCGGRMKQGRLLRVGMGRRVEKVQRTRRGSYPSKRKLHRNRKEIFCSILQSLNVFTVVHKWRDMRREVHRDLGLWTCSDQRESRIDG